MGAWLKLLTLLICGVLVLYGAPAALAVAPSDVVYMDNHLQIPFYGWDDPGTCNVSCLGFEPSLAGAMHDAATYSGKWANFTNFVLAADFGLTASDNPSQTFGVGMNGITANLSAMTATGLEFTETEYTTFNVAMPAIHVYTTQYAKEVVVTQGSLDTPIFQKDFVKTAGAFAACLSPCVFGNPANNTVVVKTPNIMPEIVDINTSTGGIITASEVFSFGLIAAIVVGFILIALIAASKRRRW